MSRCASQLAAAVVLLASSECAAAVVARLDLEDLVSGSELVGTGTVISRSSEWQGERIVTLSVLEMDSVLKAPEGAASTVTIATLGGEVGSVGMWVPGECRLETGRRYLVFASRPGPAGAAYRVTGMAQGALPVVVDDAGVAWALPPATGGLIAWEEGRLVPVAPLIGTPVPLAWIEQAIREILEEEEG
jgi:hypothetical protein